MKNFFSAVALLLLGGVENVILAPPWADPRRNPCAALPGGWQMLFWEPDGKCYKIFQMGYPCPPTQELSPVYSPDGGTVADCQCPPGTATLPGGTDCVKLFTKGPCQTGYYFAPAREKRQNLKSKNRTGVCLKPKKCRDHTKLFWPNDGRCYRRFTKGPCPQGELVQEVDGLANCTCDKEGPLSDHFSDSEKGCFEHFTRGPCPRKGDLFLPGGICGCSPDLPHYHKESESCYEIGSIGPCNRGHRFLLPNITDNFGDQPIKAFCKCKPQNVLWKQDNFCYRLYTQGPCSKGDILVQEDVCDHIPCNKGFLYFPAKKQCYKVGSQGPCDLDDIVIYDFKARPSIDGLAYNGVCGCRKALLELEPECLRNADSVEDTCGESNGMVEIGNGCHMLYTRGPCGDGQWLVPNKNDLDLKFARSAARCDCKPGHSAQYVPGPNAIESNGYLKCVPPLITLAQYLNDNHWKSNFSTS